MPRFTESVVARFWRYVPNAPSDQCWEWQGGRNKNRNRYCGYGNFNVERVLVGAHRASWEIHYGPVPAGLYVLHSCDNPACVNPAHLFIGTARDNALDRSAKGRTSRLGNPKLTRAQVREIRRLASLRTYKSLSEEFGVSPCQIFRIVKGCAWIGI